MIKICPKCGKEYSEAPGVSRIDNSSICRACSETEAIEVAVAVGAMTWDQAKKIMQELEGYRKK